MAKEVIVKAQTIKKRKTFFSNTKLVLVVILVLLLLLFILLSFIYGSNAFTITLDSQLERERGIIIYESLEERAKQRKLFASPINNMDNITYDWIPKDVHTGATGGTHNGDNYIAYTFYIENEGTVAVNYWYEIIIDDVIRGVDEAVRVMVFIDGEENIYAKLNNETGEPEEDTEAFYDDETVVLKEVRDFQVGEVNKFTIVIFLEGEDPDCLNDIIGGELMMHMEIREEHRE